MLFKKLLLAFVLTIFVFVIASVIDRLLNPPVSNTAFNTLGFIFIVGSIFVGIYVALPNILLLLMLYYTKIGREFVVNTKLLILEICTLWVCSYITGKVIDKFVQSLPMQEVFTKDGGRKFYFTDTFQFIYTFIILFFSLMLIQKIFISKKRDSASGAN